MIADARTLKAVQDWTKLYETSIQTLRVDDAYIREMAGKLTGDGPTVDAGMARLKQMSEFAVPHIVRLMADTQDAARRVTCRKALLMLGRAAVLPTVEALGSPDESLRIVLLGVLGELQDARALAAVCRLARDRETAPRVREAAMGALVRIAARPRQGLELSKTPSVNYYQLSDAYLHELDFTLPAVDGDKLPLWTWSAEKKWVTCALVPHKLYNELLAEAACYDGLLLDKEDLSLRAMAIAVYFAQKFELVGSDDSDVRRSLDLAILVGGKQALQKCLEKALFDGDAEIAIQAAQALGEVGAGKGFSLIEQLKEANPLLAALDDPDRAVRFAAACAVVTCQPSGMPEMPDAHNAYRTGRFDNYMKVLPAISWGLMYELPSRTVLIIHPSTDVINYYKGELRKLGHVVVDAATLQDGMNLAAGLPTPDVVFLAPEFMDELDGLRGMLGSPRVPVVLLAPAGAAQADAGPVIAGMLVDRAPVDNIKLVLAKTLDVPEKKLVSDLLGHISARAATGLAQVVPAASPLPMKSVAPALCRALTSTDDDVRIPALHALGRVAAGENTLNVLAVATDARAQKPVRLAALDALARILEAQDQVPPGVFAELVPVSSDKDTDVAIAAGRAIAVAKFDPAQFTDLLVLKRVQEVKAGR
jgi:HEAT repeat protein